NDHQYLQHLQDGLLERGVTTMLFTSDGPTELMLSGGRVSETLATVNFGSRQREAFELLDRLQPGQPGMCMEFWNGWFDHWGEEHHTRDAADAAAELDQLLADGRSVNLYMAHGGTNFGTWAGANLGDHDRLQPTVTSYDYDSAIAEDGKLTEKFHAFREVIGRRTGVQPPQPPADAAVQPERRVEVSDFVDLQQVLDHHETSASPAPEPFERLGLHHGVVRYRTTVTGPLSGEISLVDLADLAEVRLDGELIGRLGRLDADPAYPLASEHRLPITVAAGDHDLDVTVQSLGRVNFGPGIGDSKGVGRVRLDYQHLFGFEQSALDLETPPDLSVARWQSDGDRPGFYRTAVRLDEVADAYLELPGWSGGYLYLNGFNLGRYWNPAGPQRTLYAPAPLWRTGDNELLILEFTEPGGEIVWRAQPVLG
ncbi:MAG TPA: beta-galactosidase, partial [Microlunatus sp.]